MSPLLNPQSYCTYSETRTIVISMPQARTQKIEARRDLLTNQKDVPKTSRSDAFTTYTHLRADF